MVLRPKKTSHLTQTQDSVGKWDKWAFVGYNESALLRCPSCSRLTTQIVIDHDLKCTSCGFDLSRKKTQRAMYIEYEQVMAHSPDGGWSQQVIDALKRLDDQSGYYKPGADVARPLDGVKGAVAEKHAELKIAGQRIAQKFRLQSDVSKRLGAKPRPAIERVKGVDLKQSYHGIDPGT